MRIASRIAAVVLALSASAGMGAEPKLPAPVAAWLKAAEDICREVEGKPRLTAEAVRRADLTGDGIDDYVLTVEGIRCEGAASIYGDREKSMAVFVGDGKGGATQAFSDGTFGLDLKVEEQKPRLWLAVMGRQCGKEPARDFASERFCERPLTWDPVKRKFDYAPVSQVRMFN